MKKALRYALLAVLILFIAIQFVPNDLPPSEARPPTDLLGTGEVPADIASMLSTSCYDCHSLETKYPWYYYVAPSSWLVAKDINEARDEMVLSEWTDLSRRTKIKTLENIKDEVLEGHMPLPVYTLIHWDARLTDEQRQRIADWTDTFQEAILNAPDPDEEEEEDEDEEEEDDEDEDEDAEEEEAEEQEN